MRYVYDAVALARDPNLAGFGHAATAGGDDARAAFVERLFALVTSRAATLALTGAIAAAPSRPAVVAIEHLLATQLGDHVFEDDMKRLTGRIVRQVVEHLGGRWVRSGVPVTVRSQYRKGSIYDFGTRQTTSSAS